LDQAAVGIVSGVVGRHASGIGQEARRAEAVIGVSNDALGWLAYKVE